MLNESFNFKKCIFFISKNIFRHLKLEIASAIPVLNGWKIERCGSAVHTLMDNHCQKWHAYVNHIRDIVDVMDTSNSHTREWETWSLQRLYGEGSWSLVRYVSVLLQISRAEGIFITMVGYKKSNYIYFYFWSTLRVAICHQTRNVDSMSG